jgi:single-strand DNA-binding protein
MGLNKIILQGNLAADPEFKTTPSGVSVTTFRIAVGRRFAKPDDEIKADFFTIVAWRGTAEFVSKYFNKGSNIIVVGNLQNRSWTDNDGNKRYVTEVIADECYFGGNKEKETEHNPVGYNFVELGEDDDLPFN